MQLDMFSPVERAEPSLVGDPDGLRYYQRECVNAALAALQEWRSTLATLPTGAGKTQVFSVLAKDWPGRVLVLAHRKELVEQARARLQQITGENVGMEKAVMRSLGERIVVGSVQTMMGEHRLKALERSGGAPSLIILDESHHGIAKSWQRAMEFFPNAKVFGVTATPERADGKALGKIFESHCYAMTIQDAIGEGWLVPVRGRVERLDGLDLNKVSIVAGDLHKAELTELMVSVAEEVAQVCVDKCPGSSIIFSPGRKAAQYTAERINYLAPDQAHYVDGKTTDTEREAIFRRFSAGEFRYLVNVGVATEGFDAPRVEYVVMARPTKSKGLYVQTLGRGTRVLPGVIDDLQGKDDADERKARIAASGKPCCHLIDLVGNHTKHDLVSAVDALGGNYSDAEVKEAKKRLKKKGGEGDVLEFLKEAQASLRRVAVDMGRNRAKTKTTHFNVFDFVPADSGDTDMKSSYGQRGASAKQIEACIKMGIAARDAKNLTRKDVYQILQERDRRREMGYLTYKQQRQLERFGFSDRTIPFHLASKALDYIGSVDGFRSPSLVDPATLRRILTAP